MPVLKLNRILPYSKDVLFDIVLDVENYKYFVPWCSDSVIVSKSIGNSTMIADVSIKFGFVDYHYRSEVRWNDDRTYIVARAISGPFKYLHTNWAFKGVSDSETEVRFDIDFKVNIPIVGKLLEKFFYDASLKILDSFVKRAKDIVG